ncbi:uncharacterized protein [Littorina saxatilis]|uniref:uncharacterized protein isoform X2 n=1 Tax=Littorina saxatilis TaxID=31220 RepID=UPI0038B5924E
MTARSNIAINHPSTSIPLPPATLENSGTSQVNGPLPTIQACSIRSVTVLQIVESRESKFSNPLSAQGTATTTNKRDYSTESAVSRPPSPTAPIQGEAPNDMLMRMFNARSEQLTDSYRPNVQVNSEATAENNLKLLQELREAKEAARDAAFKRTLKGKNKDSRTNLNTRRLSHR